VRLPVVEMPGGERLFGPSLKEVASRLVSLIALSFANMMYQSTAPALPVVRRRLCGSEGLSTVLIERSAGLAVRLALLQ